MVKELTIHYYEEGDELNVLAGKPKAALYIEVGDEVFARVDAETQEVLLRGMVKCP